VPFVVLAVVVVSCEGGDAIDWTDPAPLAAALVATPDVVLDMQGRLAARTPESLSPPASAAQCAGSVRVARDTTGDWFAVWWSLRQDSTADLVVSRSANGVAWDPAARVDTVDVGAVACRRPPPSISVDHGNVYVAYAMAAREGPGIFASHSMDRAMTFHTAVPVVYGERLGLASIVARGDVVAVAYEDPNSDPQRIGLALSRSQGHIFEHRELVSPPTGPASRPSVAMNGRMIAVTWRQGVPTDSSAPRMAREGRIQ
jgi:hypothetical protein